MVTSKKESLGKLPEPRVMAGFGAQGRLVLKLPKRGCEGGGERRRPAPSKGGEGGGWTVHATKEGEGTRRETARAVNGGGASRKPNDQRRAK